MNARKIQIVTGAIVLLGLLLVPVQGAFADGIVIPEPVVPVPIVDVPYLTIKYHRVTVTIVDQVATTHVDQVFVNDSRHEVEGTYVFPLPEKAAISHFSMWVDGEQIEGRVLERDEARRIYEDIVRRRRDPALLEYVGRNAFQASIYPVPPGGERRIELEYAQVLPVDNGLVAYVYPLNTEKFSPRPLEEVTVNVSIRSNEPLKAIYSPSHNVDVVRQGDSSALVGYEAYDVTPDQDFALYYTVSAQDVGLNLLTYKPDDRGDGFFLLLVAPQAEIDVDEIIAKDMILVLDVSGSMRGEKIAQAKQALTYVLDSLHEEDRFNIIAFSASTHHYARNLVSSDERGEARDFVRRLDAGGSTDINRALLEALDLVDPQRPGILVFLTDGLPTVGEVEVARIIDNVRDTAPSNARIFPFGVGYDVDTVLLDTIASSHRGSSGYVQPRESIDEKVSAFYAKISTPLLADLKIDFARIDADDIYPHQLPDLFAGGQLVAVGRYRNGGDTAITLSGVVGDEPQTFYYDDIAFSREGGTEFIARLWATRKIGYLLQQIRLRGEASELVDEVVDLSVRYGIITPYTSFLVEETEVALRQSGREALSADMQAEATAVPASGKQAVERSVGENLLSAADAVVAPSPGAAESQGPSDQSSPVKYVGDKTFILNQGVWTDTEFDSEAMTTVPVDFGSDDYFALVAARPEWGRYFALGEQVIVVWKGTAYEVNERATQSLEESGRSPADRSEPSGPLKGGFLRALAAALMNLVEELVASVAQ